MQVNLKLISHEEKIGKSSGKQYTSCRLTVWSAKENKDVIISGFGNEITKTWNPGDTVDINVAQNEKGYLNFELNENSRPSENPVVKALKEISGKLDVLIAKKEFNGEVVDLPSADDGMKKPGEPGYIDPKEIPF